MYFQVNANKKKIRILGRNKKLFFLHTFSNNGYLQIRCKGIIRKLLRSLFLHNGLSN